MAEHERRLHLESRELEIRRQQIELRGIEIEFETRANEFSMQHDEVALDAIEMVTRYMEPPAAAEFLSDILDDVKSPRVRNKVRFSLAQVLFRTERPDEAAEQLRALIAPE